MLQLHRRTPGQQSLIPHRPLERKERPLAGGKGREGTCRVLHPGDEKNTFQADILDTETAQAYTAAGYEVNLRADGQLTVGRTHTIITTTFGNTSTVVTQGLELGSSEGYSSRMVYAVIAATATPLHDAAGVGNAERVRELIGDGADVNAKGSDTQIWTPLHLAAFQGQVETTQMLIEARGLTSTPRTLVATAHCTWRSHRHFRHQPKR